MIAGGDVVAFVDDDDVPPGVLEVVAVVVGRAATELGFEVEEGVIEMGTRIRDELGPGWIEPDDFILQLGQELGAATPHQFRNAIARQEVSAVAGGVDAPDQPFLVPDDDAGS